MVLNNERIEHFSGKDILISFFGALLVALSLIFRGTFIEISINLNIHHLFYIILMTIFVLSAEIYFLGYSRVRDKKERPFGQFIFKRVTTIYCVSLLVSALIIILYDMTNIVTEITRSNVINLIISTAFPSSIGAALTDLLKRF